MAASQPAVLAQAMFVQSLDSRWCSTGSAQKFLQRRARRVMLAGSHTGAPGWIGGSIGRGVGGGRGGGQGGYGGGSVGGHSDNHWRQRHRKDGSKGSYRDRSEWQPGSNPFSAVAHESLSTVQPTLCMNSCSNSTPPRRFQRNQR